MTGPAMVEEQLARHRRDDTEVVGPERRAFLNAGLKAHLGAELDGDIPAIVSTFAPGGHLNFNGTVYDTPERLSAFHQDFGWDGRGALSDIGGEIARLHYTHDSVIVEYVVRCTVAAPLHGAPAGRAVEFPMCGIYQFDEAGKLLSERGYADSGALLPEPVLPL